jgi:hypothetical protein
MSDPWDDFNYGSGGVLITPSGMRIPLSAASPSASASAPTAPPSTAPSSSAAAYSGVGPKGYRRTDQRVREDICERLLLDPYLDASGVVVSVSKGRVSLKGRVPSERIRDGVIAAAERVAPGAVKAELQITGSAGTARSGRRRAAARKRPRTARKRTKRGGSR